MFDFEKANELLDETHEIAIPSIESESEIEKKVSQFQFNMSPTVNDLVFKSNNVQVDTMEDATQALSMALQARKLVTALHDSRKEIIKPQMDFQKAINKLTADYADKLKEIEENLKKKLENWIEKDDTQAFSKLESIHVEDGTMKRVDKWDFEMTDTVDIPFEYLCADTEEIAKAVKHGVREIPGVKIFLKQELAFRVKN